MMGFFGTYLFDGQRWMPHDTDKPPTIPEPWLLIDIHDSDITTITYQPTRSGSGVAYLGVTPRTYFEDPGASASTDVAREAGGLAEWWSQYRRTADDARAWRESSRTRHYLAADIVPDDLDSEEDDEDLEDADVFVEVKTARFLAVLDLPPISGYRHPGHRQRSGRRTANLPSQRQA
jgi:hypothetical protein